MTKPRSHPGYTCANIIYHTTSLNKRRFNNYGGNMKTL